MRGLYKILLILAGSLALYSCESDEPIDGQPTLVVEGWIENGMPPVVILTKTLNFSTELTPLTDIEDYIIKWAKVSVSDGNKTVVLTGKYAPEYFPPYIYTTGHMLGQAGHTYSVTVEYDNFHATAQTSIPEPPDVKDYRVVPSAQNDTLYQIEILLQDNNPDIDYYQAFVKNKVKSKQYLSAYMGSFNDEILSEGAYIPIFNGVEAITEKFSPFYTKNDSISVKIAHIDHHSYEFWDQYSKNVQMPSNMFLTSVSWIPTNVTGGIGYWCGMGCWYKNIAISDYISPK